VPTAKNALVSANGIIWAKKCIDYYIKGCKMCLGSQNKNNEILLETKHERCLFIFHCTVVGFCFVQVV